MKIQQDTVAADYKDVGPFREVREVVRFLEPFKRRPYVLLSLERADVGQFIERSMVMGKEGNRLLHTVYRLDMSASNVSPTGFVLNIGTWQENLIYGYRVTWTAISDED